MFSERCICVVAVATLLSVLSTPARTNLAVNPQSLNFGHQQVGATSAPLTLALTNNTRSSIHIVSISSSSNEFSYSGEQQLPMTLNAGQSVTGLVTFAPTASQTYSGVLTFVRGNGLSIRVFLTGTGIGGQSSQSGSSGTVPSGLLAFSNSMVSFGSVNVGSSSSENVVVSNVGSASVAISNITVSGAGVGASGLPVGLVLAPNQTATLGLTFTPATAGNVTGSATITSNATNSPNSVTLSGTGVQTTSYSVDLSWTPSTSAGITGYDIYRGTTSGGPYAILSTTTASATSYTDLSVQSGQTYYYVLTAVDSSNTQSAFSATATATIP